MKFSLIIIHLGTLLLCNSSLAAVLLGLKNKISLLDHPACSPDLNPIENIWGRMAREVYKNGHQFQTVDALREAIFNTWSNVPTSLLEKLASSMPKRLFEVINKNGGASHYRVLFLTL
uniref:Tc1-like transposase DDE domain-containing protein n=1 Tax=Cyprinodon variegatus TaxID=28743 RepID=A0A3Q2G3V1_CYPVA